MNPIFNQGVAPHHRLLIMLVVSASLIFLDHSQGKFEAVRGYLQSLVTPLQYLANTPAVVMDWASENVITRQELIAENQKYKQEELLHKEQALQLDIVKRENKRLRALLGSPVSSDMRKMVAEILSVDSDRFSHQIVINRGATNGVYEGQPVLDSQGIVGQILHVGTSTSRVLLISDVSHGIPVRNQRNGIRLIANGVGRLDRLELVHVPHSTDIRTGDLLVTSGLGGKFPEGYPVAKVSFVSLDESRPFAQIYAEPVAQLDRLRYLLLLWLAENMKTEQSLPGLPNANPEGAS
jgi:rod shape-determining protein MreC